jgi:hypothetical protein
MLKIILASFLTLSACLMAAAAAFDRGGTAVDKGLLIVMSIMIVLAVHLIPAISHRPISWVIWTGCLCCAIFGHLTFLIHANLRAGEALAQQSSLAVGTNNQIKAVREALEQVKARPLTVISAQLAQESDRRVRYALKEEMSASKKAEQLRDELVHLARISTAAKKDAAIDPVMSKLAQVSGFSQGGISVMIGLMFAILIEVLGALVWVEALRPSGHIHNDNNCVGTTKVNIVTRHVPGNVPINVTGNMPGNVSVNMPRNVSGNVSANVSDMGLDKNLADAIVTLKAAILEGKCKVTVNGIQRFFRCGRGKAQRLNKIMKGI